MKRILALLLIMASVLLPTAIARAVQYDMIKNMTASTRTYTVSNPTATISIPGGQEAIIQDTQYQSSSAMQSDVSAGYLQEIVIGSPNATQTQYTQPVTITSSSSSAAGLLISESNGLQPGISVTQNNAGDIADLYQSATLEYGLSNTLFHVAPPTQLDQNLTLDHSVTSGGLIQFGSTTAAQLQYNTTAPGGSSISTPAQNAFAFSAPLTIENYNGVYLGTYQVLYSDNTSTNLTLQAPGSSGSVIWKNGSGTLGSITSSGLTLGSSTYGTNVSIGGTLTVSGLSNLGALTDSTTTTTEVIGNNGTNKNLQLNAGTSNGYIYLTNSTGATTNSKFNDDGSGSLAKGILTWDGSGNLSAASLATSNQLFMGTTGGYFNNNGGVVQYVDGANGGFKVLNNATTASNLVLNDNGSGSIAQGNISWTNAGVLTVAGLTANGGLTITGNTSISGTLASGDITTSRSASVGYLFLGSNGQHSIGFDGTNYQLANAGLVLNGALSAQAITENSTLTLVPINTATSLSNYASNLIDLQNSTWNGTTAVTNTASISLASNNAVTFSTPATFQFNGNTFFNNNVSVPGTLTTGTIINSGVITLNSGSNAVNITSSAVNFSSGQSLNIGSTTLSATGLTLNGGLIATTGSFSGNISGTTGNFSGALTIASLTTNGNGLFTGLLHAGGSTIAFGSNGDIVAERGSTSGYLYLGNTGTHYLSYNGSSYSLANASLSVGGQITATQFNGSGAGLTGIPDSALTTTPVNTILSTGPISISGNAPTITVSCATCMTGVNVGEGLVTTGGTDPTINLDQSYTNVGSTITNTGNGGNASIALPSYGKWHLQMFYGTSNNTGGSQQVSVNTSGGTCNSFGTNATGASEGPGTFNMIYAICDTPVLSASETMTFTISVSQGSFYSSPYQPWTVMATRTS